MQELRFVGVEDGAVIATNEAGERFRLVIDEPLRRALRPQPEARPSAPKVPPRVIQQLIRAGATVDEVVARTGADQELVERFEGPILAERGYIVEQARAVPVRVAQPLDPLAGEGATFGSAIDERLERLAARDIRWDAWRDPDAGWHVGLDFVTDEVTRNALWRFDARTHTLEAASPAAITLSQQGELPPLGGPYLHAVETHPTDAVIPVADRPRRDDPFEAAEASQATTHETANLLEELRRRRGERSAAPYDEEAEFADGDLEEYPFVMEHGEAAASDGEQAGTIANVTPFSRGAVERPRREPEDDAPAPADGAEADRGADADPDGSRAEPAARVEHTVEVPLEGMEAPPAAAQAQRRRSGRPSMPSWDEIVFGTRSDDD